MLYAWPPYAQNSETCLYMHAELEEKVTFGGRGGREFVFLSFLLVVISLKNRPFLTDNIMTQQLEEM